ncbi:MAG: 4-alpha-glucanotransferase, partial [Bacillota bacterium]|nr:4-alpha-glucanotransferase [Bacillota bacterium]
EVVALKEQFGLPGMKVLHFIFEGGVKDLFVSLNEKNTVMYTGTHDNDTTVGWYKKAVKTNHPVVRLAEKYFQITPSLSDEELSWRFIKIAYQSSCEKVIIPLQDILALGTEARMNYPGTVGGNWRWRLQEGQLTPDIEAKLKRLAKDTY